MAKFPSRIVISRFTNLKFPSAFSSAERVRVALNKAGRPARTKTVRKNLSTQPSYVRQRITRRRFPRQSVRATALDEWWQADTLYMKDFSNENNGYAYCLVVVDVFSRYIFAAPLKTLTAKESAEAFKRILQTTNRTPKYLYTDDGNEYKREFAKLLKRMNITKVVSRSWVKASIVERANRTLKERVMRYMQHSYQYNWTKKLQDIVKTINDSVNRTIGVCPSSVNYFNQQQLFYKSRGMPSNRYIVQYPTAKFKFEVGERVVHQLRERAFRRGYDRNWTVEEFIINRRFPTRPPTYELRKSVPDPITKSSVILNHRWYEPQLQSVNIGKRFAEVEVLQARGAGRNKEVLVHYLIEPDYAQHWISASLLRKTGSSTNR